MKNQNQWAHQETCSKVRGGCGAILQYIPSASALVRRSIKSLKKKTTANAGRPLTIQERAQQALVEKDPTCPRCERGLHKATLNSGQQIWKCDGWKTPSQVCTVILPLEGERLRVAEADEEKPETKEISAPSSERAPMKAASKRAPGPTNHPAPDGTSAGGSGKPKSENPPKEPVQQTSSTESTDQSVRQMGMMQEQLTQQMGMMYQHMAQMQQNQEWLHARQQEQASASTGIPSYRIATPEDDEDLRMDDF